MINNEHIYVNDELSFKTCKNKSKHAEFSLRFSKNVNQLNEILSAFELNANVHFSMRTSVLSIVVDIFKIAANYTCDSKKEKYRFFEKSFETKKKKKNSLKIDKKEIFRKLKKEIKRKKKLSTTKFVRTKNYVFGIINDDDKMMKDTEIKFAFAHKCFVSEI